MRILNHFLKILFYAAILTASIVLIMIATTPTISWKISKGEVSPVTIRAPKSIVYQSLVKTDELKNNAALDLKPIYKYDPNVAQLQQFKANDAFTVLEKIADDQTKNLADKIKGAKKILNINEEDLNDFFGSDSVIRVNIKNEVGKVLGDIQSSNQIKEEELASYANQIKSKISGLDETSSRIASNIGGALLLSNTFIDKTETEALTKKFQENVSPVVFSIDKDQIVVEKGAIIDDLIIEKLSALGLTKSSGQIQNTIGNLLFYFIYSILLVIFFLYFSKNKGLRAFFVLLIMIFGTVLAARLLIPIKSTIAYGLPVAAVVITASLLFGDSFAFLLSPFVAFIPGFCSGSSLEVLVVQLFICLWAGYVSMNAKSFSGLLRAILTITVFCFLLSLSFLLMDSPLTLRSVGLFAIASITNGFLSIVGALGFVAIFGGVLGTTTFLQLLELGNPNNPLLRRLSLEAPGTYHHSMMTANLAERAAKAVGADALLARVATYFHDVGKLSGPVYFVENQGGGPNIHDDVADPYKSAQIVIDHLTDGVNLLKKNKLPKGLIEIVAQHHGSTMVAYFYEKAREQTRGGQEIDQSLFRYPGPKPSSKEAGILMLADSVEAAVRSLEDKNQDSIESIVSNIFEARTGDGQLLDCPLTFHEIEKIKNVFINTLLVMYHQRVEYPNNNKKRIK